MGRKCAYERVTHGILTSVRGLRRCGVVALSWAMVLLALVNPWMIPSHADGGLGLPTNPRVTKVAAQVVTASAYPSYTFTGFVNGESWQDGLVSWRGWQYAAYWDSLGQVVVARHELPDGPWEQITFPDYLLAANDSHRAISLGIDHTDGTIHLLFDMHATPVNYRVSVPGIASDPATAVWDATSFGPVEHALTAADSQRLTYPQFVNTPSGGLELLLRDGVSGAGDEVLYRRTASGWHLLGTVIDGEDKRGPYLFGADYVGHTLMMSWTWRENGDPNSNHDLLYATSPDLGRTWYDDAGALAGTIGTAPMTMETPGLVVVPVGRGRGLHNQESMAIDSQGQPHILASYLPPSAPDDRKWVRARKSAVLVHVYRDAHGTWHQQFTHYVEGETRSQIGFDSGDDLVIVTGGSVRRTDGHGALRILGATRSAGWDDLRTRFITPKSSVLCDPLIDRALLRTDDQLSVYYVARKGKVLKVGQWGLTRTAYAGDGWRPR